MINRQLDRFKSLSRTSRAVFTVILTAMIVVGVYAFFTSEVGRTVALVCCGGIIVLVIVGILSEMRMKR
ncbi:MAG: hypothetical protein NZM00_08130 [Anaerolinea sp.]|nr:hypothetical protein [Anaerolinea sp.]